MVSRSAMRSFQTSAVALTVTFASVSALGQTTPEGAPTGPGSDPAQAAPDPTVDQARDAFTLGTSLANQGEWPEALRAFERSAKLHPHPVTTYNVAYCERALGRYTRAYKLFVQSLSEHESATTGKLPDDLLALAKSYGAEVEHRLAHVFVRIANPGTALSVDGRPLEASSKGAKDRVTLLAGTRDDRGNEAPPAASFELLIDPGRHLIVSSRPGTPDQVVSETFESGTSRELVLGAASEPAPKKSEAPVQVDTDLPSGSSRKTWAYVSYGVGGAGLVTGTVFGLLAIGKKSYLDANGCPSPQTCDAAYQGDIDTAKLNAWVATGGFIVAGLGAGVGTYLLLTSGPEKPAPEKRAATIEPLLGPGMVGARGRF